MEWWCFECENEIFVFVDLAASCDKRREIHIKVVWKSGTAENSSDAEEFTIPFAIWKRGEKTVAEGATG